MWRLLARDARYRVMDGATRREIDTLTARADRLEARLENIDANGTRGTTALQVQITQLAADVGELRGQGAAWQERHTELHALEQADRVRARRWLVTTGLAGVATIAGLYPLIYFVLTRR